MKVSLSTRELFLVILLVATVSLFLNIQASNYGLLINGGNLVFSSNVTYDVTETRLVQNEAFKIVGGRSLNQHGPEVRAVRERTLNATSSTLIKRLIQIESRLMSISRQPIVALVTGNVDNDVTERLKIKNVPIQTWKTSDHLNWIDDSTVVQNGNWSVLLCTHSNLCPDYRGTMYKKVNTIKAMKEYINNSTKLCELSRKIDEEFQDLNCEEPYIDPDRRNTVSKSLFAISKMDDVQGTVTSESKKRMRASILPSVSNKLSLSTFGPLLQLRMLVTSLVPLRFYIHSTVSSGPLDLLYPYSKLNQIPLEEIFQYISETYGLGMSSRWWITLQTTLVKYLTQITVQTQHHQHTYGRCDRCFLEIYTDIICSSIEHCLVLKIKPTDIWTSSTLLDTLSVTTASASPLNDVIVALQTAQVCDGLYSESCLTDTDLVYLLDTRREQLVDGNWIKIYPAKDGSSTFSHIADLDIVLRRRNSGLTNQILSYVEQYHARADAENKNIVDLPYDTDVGVHDNLQDEKELYGPVNYICSEDVDDYKYIDSIHTEPKLEFKEIKHLHLYTKVPYEMIIVRIWAYAKSCRCSVKLDNKYNSPGARNVSIGLGNNTFHLLVVDKTLTDPKIVSTITLSIYRPARGYTLLPDINNMNNIMCELNQDCSLPFDTKDECGLRESSFKTVHSERCTSGNEAGRWLVPCSDCGNPNTCAWRDAKWQPFKCSYKTYTSHALKQCLQDKTLLFIGDSTNRGIMNYIMEQINGTLRHWDKIHNTRAYTNINHNSTHFTFAYYPHFWLPADHRPKFQKTIFQIIKSSLPLYNNASTVLIVGGVQWLAREHIDSIIEALKKKGLSNITVVIKGLGAGFHQPVEGVRFVPPEQQQSLQQKEGDILSYAKERGFRAVSTFNMTMSRYRDFLEGKCACHFHKVSKVQSDSRNGFEPGYSISGDVNAAYSLIVADQICGGAA